MNYLTFGVADLFAGNILLGEAGPEGALVEGTIRPDEVEPDDAVAAAGQIIPAFGHEGDQVGWFRLLDELKQRCNETGEFRLAGGERGGFIYHYSNGDDVGAGGDVAGDAVDDMEFRQAGVPRVIRAGRAGVLALEGDTDRDRMRTQANGLPRAGADSKAFEGRAELFRRGKELVRHFRQALLREQMEWGRENQNCEEQAQPLHRVSLLLF
jgi:hypothetical protein